MGSITLNVSAHFIGTTVLLPYSFQLSVIHYLFALTLKSYSIAISIEKGKDGAPSFCHGQIIYLRAFLSPLKRVINTVLDLLLLQLIDDTNKPLPKGKVKVDKYLYFPVWDISR